ncbi:MAG: acyl-CoA thioesterase [Microcella sp.]|uniref:acyl-CoA thioesterase n=1 Tax=Microcella sp. TaxID=1913979 RepID=UPI0024CA0D68|nr:thioesterase family protein [Microcella sp.]UYN84676.1 MAG: acyl-CoA thioesterase [Microcella sp.]
MRLHVAVPLRWSDLDAYGHVNNARMLTLLEEARIAAFWSVPGSAAPTAVLDTGPGSPTVTLVAAQRIEYLVPIPYLREPLDVELWIGRLGGASLEISYEIFSAVVDGERTLYTRASTTLVLVDRASGEPRRVSDDARAAWQPYIEPPVVFRG